MNVLDIIKANIMNLFKKLTLEIKGELFSILCTFIRGFLDLTIEVISVSVAFTIISDFNALLLSKYTSSFFSYCLHS